MRIGSASFGTLTSERVKFSNSRIKTNYYLSVVRHWNTFSSSLSSQRCCIEGERNLSSSPYLNLTEIRTIALTLEVNS